MIRINNKGFTLIELLAIITILSIILMISFVTVSSILTNSKDKLQETQKKQILRSAELYNNKEGLYDYDICVDLETLEEKGYIKEEDLKDPKTGESLNGSVKIYHEINKYSYEYSDKACLCKNLDNKGNYDIGTKYSCEVKDGTSYNFYILSKNDDTSVNLIMDRNICNDGTIPTDTNPCLYAWHAEADDNNYGPDTAMTNLYNGTKDWTNIPDMIMNYEDEENKNDNSNGYQSMVTNKNTMVTTIIGKQNKTSESQTFGNAAEPLKARLPKLEEVYNTDSNDLTRCHDAYGTCPAWLTNALQVSAPYYPDNDHIEGILGYWTLSSYHNYSGDAHIVLNHGYGDFNMSTSNVNNVGIRPVITVSSSDLSK